MNSYWGVDHGLVSKSDLGTQKNPGFAKKTGLLSAVNPLVGGVYASGRAKPGREGAVAGRVAGRSIAGGYGGLAAGGAAGAGVGAGIGALVSRGKGAKTGALVGGFGGAAVGGPVGQYRGGKTAARNAVRRGDIK